MGVKVPASFFSSGDWKDTTTYLEKLGKGDFLRGLESLAQKGINALRSATPVRSGVGASSWYYEIKQDRGGATIIWKNSDVEGGFPVVIMLQYGHGTGTGGYVQGYDFINPAIRPIMDEIANTVWKKVTS